MMVAMSRTFTLGGRRSNRLLSWDYTTAGAYFVTIATFNRERLFEDSSLRRIVERTWVSVIDESASIESGDFVVMPDHVHGLVWIRASVGASHSGGCPGSEPSSLDCRDDSERDDVSSDSPLRASGAPSGSLGAIVGSFKTVASKRLNRWTRTPGKSIWQRNYYERVVRNDEEFESMRLYILANPFNVGHDHDALENIDSSILAKAAPRIESPRGESPGGTSGFAVMSRSLSLSSGKEARPE
jgi:REP element-mobilizing transposase RayT